MKIRRLIAIAVLALLPLSAYAWGVVSISGGVEAAGATYLVNEGFEGTEGASPGVPSGWTAIGTTVNCDYTTSPIAGSQSLYIPSSSGVYNGAYVSFSGASTIYAAGKFTLPATITEVDDNTFIEFRTSGGTSLCKVMLVWYTNHIHVSLKAGAGTKVNDSTIELAATSTYSWWFDYTADGGSNNGTGNFYLVADSNTKPTVLLTVSDGDVDGNPAQLATENRYTAAKFDSILVDDADIGNLQ